MKWIIRLFKAGIILAILGMLSLAGVYFYLAPELPSIEKIKDIRFQVPLRIYTRDGLLIQEFGEKHRIPVSYDELPPWIVQSFLAAEDDRYFDHHGVDYRGLIAAVVGLIKTGEKNRGGSTITMQVAKNLFLSPEKKIKRKLMEIILAFQIEQELDKKQIMELYLNKIFMGHRAYGIGAAAQVYYGKKIDELNLAQIAMIAGLPKAPSAYNPVTNPERALLRRDYVLGRMLKLQFITQQEYQQAKDSPVTAQIHYTRSEVSNPYAGEMVRAWMIERFGEEETYTGGYSVTTTIDSILQPAADKAVRRALREYDVRHGFRGAEAHFDLATVNLKGDQQTDNKENQEGDEDDKDRQITDPLQAFRAVADLIPALIMQVDEKSFLAQFKDGQQVTVDWTGMKWARRYINRNARGGNPKSASDIVTAGDVVRLRLVENINDQQEITVSWQLSQIPDVAGALVALDTSNGAIRSLVGGYDYYLSKFNRATQAKRQPGSGFKAIIYSSALNQGYNPASLINDAPVVFDDVSLEGEWRPENYSGKFFGPTRLRIALTKSRNLVSIRLLRSMGIDTVLEHAARFGFDPQELPHNLSLSLGSAVVTPLQMSQAYALLANGGYRVAPYYIESVQDVDKNIVFQAQPLTVCPVCLAEVEQSIASTTELPPQSNAAPRVISKENHYLMNSMMRDVVRAGTATKARSLGRNDLAGKTGTTNDQRDAWFNGFHPTLAVNTWVGFDNNDKLGRGEVGGKAALPAWIYFMETALDGVPESPLKMPSGIVQVLIDPNTGKRAYPGQPDAVFEVFPKDQVPTEQMISVESPSNTANPAQSGTQPGNSELPPTSLDIF